MYVTLVENANWLHFHQTFIKRQFGDICVFSPEHKLRHFMQIVSKRGIPEKLQTKHRNRKDKWFVIRYGQFFFVQNKNPSSGHWNNKRHRHTNKEELPLRKHAYSSILNISPPKTENSQIKLLYFSYFCSKHRLCVDEAVLTSTQNLCFWAEIRKIMYTPVNLFYYIKVGLRGQN